MNIINKSSVPTPEWFEEQARFLCWKAHIAPISLTIEIKKLNKPPYWQSRTWHPRLFKAHANSPSGVALTGGHKIIVRMARHSLREDILYVLAHEIGHVMDYRQHGQFSNHPEKIAREFAVACNCYPKTFYHKRTKK